MEVASPLLGFLVHGSDNFGVTLGVMYTGVLLMTTKTTQKPLTDTKTNLFVLTLAVTDWLWFSCDSVCTASEHRLRTKADWQHQCVWISKWRLYVNPTEVADPFNLRCGPHLSGWEDIPKCLGNICRSLVAHSWDLADMF